MRTSARLLFLTATLLGGCDHHVEALPEPAAPASGDPSLPAGARPLASAVEPPLVEREDIPLGKPCHVRLARLDPSKPEAWSTTDPEWERLKGQRFVTCHFTLSPKLAPFDVEIVTAAGANSVERVTVHRAGEASPATSFEGMLTIPNWSSVDIEATDVNFDGVKDLVMPRSHGTSGCSSYHYFVYAPAVLHGASERFIDSAIQETCNPVPDAKRGLVITDMDDAEGIVRWRWNGFDFARVRRGQ